MLAVDGPYIHLELGELGKVDFPIEGYISLG
jgi:hypothetical protein